MGAVGSCSGKSAIVNVNPVKLPAYYISRQIIRSENNSRAYYAYMKNLQIRKDKSNVKRLWKKDMGR